MSPTENFHFFTRLPPDEVMQRLEQSAQSNQPGSFYGELKHHIFILHCRIGGDDQHPLVSGHVLPEGEGARVHAMVKVSYTQEYYAKFAGVLLLLLVAALILLNWGEVSVPRDGQAFFLSLMEVVLMLMALLMVAVPVGLSWRHLKHFRKHEMVQAAASLKMLLDVEEA